MVRRDANPRLTLTDIKLKLGIIRKMVVGEGAAPLPPPGTLIWRLPGFIKLRCAAGATHRFAESYYGSSCIPTGYRVTREM
jgi:hypothetical protein